MTAPNQLKRRAWPGVFLRSLGHASWAAEQTAAGINFLGSRHQAPFSSWAGPAQITSTLGFTTIEVPLVGGQIARLAGVTPHDAARAYQPKDQSAGGIVGFLGQARSISTTYITRGTAGRIA